MIVRFVNFGKKVKNGMGDFGGASSVEEVSETLLEYIRYGQWVTKFDSILQQGSEALSRTMVLPLSAKRIIL